MVNFILNLLLLSLVFGILSVVALLFRYKYLHGKGSIMYFIWFPVLILSVIPLRLCPAISVSGNVDIDSILRSEAELELLRNTNGDPLETLSYPIGEFRLSLINDVSSIDPVERINALYSVSPRIIGGDYTYSGAALLDKTGNYIYPLFFTLAMTWMLGALSCFISALRDYRRTNERLDLYSTVYYDAYDGGRLGAILKAAQRKAGVRRQVKLRLVDWQAAVSPCVSGLFRPVIYIGEDIARIDSEKLELIIAHELIHCRRCDVIYKFAILLVSSVHWFNGLSKLVAKAAYEDCELSCDSCVLTLYGTDKSDFYMMTILDIAENYYRSAFQRAHSNELVDGMFLNGSSGKSFLKRRYANIKTEINKATKRKNLRSTSILLLLCLALNVLIMSACGVGEVKSGTIVQDNVKLEFDPYVMSPVASAIRNYYHVLDVVPLTEEQLAGVESIDVRLCKDVIFNDSLVIFINGTAVPTFNTLISKDNMKKITDGISAQNSAESKEELRKLESFYTLKDPNDPNLTAAAVNEVLEVFPFTAVVPTYIFDPYASFREIGYIESIYKKYDFYMDIEMIDDQVAEFVEAYIRDNGLSCKYSVKTADFAIDSYDDYNLANFEKTLG